MNPKYFSRAPKHLRPEKIRSSCIGICGAGSGGSLIADDFIRLGAKVVLLDLPSELLDGHNILRHILSSESLGKVKHEEVAKHLRKVNPGAEVHSFGIDIAKEPERLAELFQHHKPSLIISAVDNEEAKYVLADLARNLGVTLVIGGVYDEGRGGEVLLIDPGAVCLGCMNEQILGTRRRPEPEVRTLDYTNPDLQEFKAVRALRPDIASVAGICVRGALQRLLGGGVEEWGIPEGANLIVFANRPIAGISEAPLSARFFQIKGNPSCPVCGVPSAAPTSADFEKAIAGIESCEANPELPSPGGNRT